jgi:hydrogenase maturation protease
LKTVIIGLGNDLIGDDAVGLIAARRLGSLLGDGFCVVESNLYGLALIEIMTGYDRAVILDAVRTGKHPPGTVIELDPFDFLDVSPPSPHFTGIRELAALAARLRLYFPREIRIFGIEVIDLESIGTGLSHPLVDEIEKIVDIIKDRIYELDSARP